MVRVSQTGSHLLIISHVENNVNKDFMTYLLIGEQSDTIQSGTILENVC